MLTVPHPDGDLLLIPSPVLSAGSLLPDQTFVRLSSIRAMSLTGIKNQLHGIHNAGGTPKDQVDKYREVFRSVLLTAGDQEKEESIRCYVDTIVLENVSLVISRQLLTEVAKTVTELPQPLSKSLCHYMLERVQPRVVSFEEQIVAIRQHLASIFENEGRWRESADILSGIPLETGQKQYAAEFKLQTYLKIARLYLEDDDPIQAEGSINRATLLQNETTNEELQILYKFCYARVLVCIS